MTAVTSTTSITTALVHLSTLLHLSTTAFSIGVNYGTLANDLPSPSQVANFLRTKTIIDSIKIFDTNPDILRGFANTNITVTVTVGNGDIPALVDANAASLWVANNIEPFYPQTRIKLIAVGNEILFSGNKEWISHLVPCIKSLHQALVRAGIDDVKVSTPYTLGILQDSVQPSAARIKPAYGKVVFAPMLEFLRQTKSPLLINPYPYFSYSPSMENYILFKPNPGIHDDNTNITYTNMFTAMMDAVYSAIKAMGYDDVDIVVAESGWPSLGDPDQPMCTVENAVLYNKNMIKVATAGEGTPLMPNRRFETYIFALFNENLKPGTAAEKNWGLFRPDFSPVYDVGIMSSAIGKDWLAGRFSPATPVTICKVMNSFSSLTCILQSTGSSPSPSKSPSTGSSPSTAASPYPAKRPSTVASPSPPTSPSTGESRAPTTSPSSGSASSPTTTSKTGSGPTEDASDRTLQANKDDVCSQGAQCKPIQTGGACSYPSNVWPHSSSLIPLIMIWFVYI